MGFGAMFAAEAGGKLLDFGLRALQNRKSRKFSREMYGRQYKDSVDFWRMQNEYNSPQAQMKRLQEAGINPHAFYAKGGANPGLASSINTPDVQRPEWKDPSIGLGSTLGNSLLQFQDYKIKQAQNDNLKRQNTNMRIEGLLKSAQVNKTIMETNRGKFDLSQAKRLADLQHSALEENVRQLRETTNIRLSEEERKKALFKPTMEQAALSILQSRMNLARTAQEMSKIKATIANIKSDTTLKRLEAELNKEGIYKSDPLWLRMVVKRIEDIMNAPALEIDVEKLKGKAKRGFFKYMFGY